VLHQPQWLQDDCSTRWTDCSFGVLGQGRHDVPAVSQMPQGRYRSLSVSKAFGIQSTLVAQTQQMPTPACEIVCKTTIGGRTRNKPSIACQQAQGMTV